MVMHPVLRDGYSCWCIHAGFLFLFILFIHLELCLVKGFSSEILPQRYLQSDLYEIYSRTPYYHFEKASCEDLKGVGSLNSTCLLSIDLHLDADLNIYGSGNLEVSPNVLIVCPINGCSISVIVSGYVKIGSNATIIAGSVVFDAANVTLDHHSAINTTALGGPPPAQTSGTPFGYDGSGGGHGGRGSNCVKSNKTNWGGDVYAWSTLSEPWSYGSKGGSAAVGTKYGGDGGGRVMLNVKDFLQVDGYVTAEGGKGGITGGGGSGGSIMIHALKLKGDGTISAAGGSGWGGGGGGRISLECYSKQQDADEVLAVLRILVQLAQFMIEHYLVLK